MTNTAGLYSPQRSMQMSVVGVIFADSIQTGDREKVYTVFRIISNLGGIVGPVPHSKLLLLYTLL